MKVIAQIKQLKEQLAQLKRERNGADVGFVPTMGFLHSGHMSLVKEAKQSCGIVVMSIFVNPLQFGPNEDFERYPRDHERDLRMAEEAGVDIVFLPEVSEMYPRPMRTNVAMSGLTDMLCGASRPGHFDGVATVVTKLFNIVQPNRAYFGMKDAQQVAVIRQMVDDLNMNVEVIPCQTVREADGLAMSSRNVYLNPEERKQALVLSQSLAQAKRWLEGKLAPEEIRRRVIEHITTAPLAQIDYVEVLDYPSLTPVQSYAAGKESSQAVIVALAVKFGRTRLIDNLLVEMGN